MTETHVTIHAVLDHAPDVVWLHTHGMAGQDCPDLEWYWSPARTWQEGATILNHIACYVAASRPAIEEGQVAWLEASELRVQFLEPIAQAEHGFEGNRAWRLEPITTGAAAVETFRQLICDDPAGGLFTADDCNRRGNALLQQGDAEGALAAYQEALAADPARAMPHRNLGLVLHILGRHEEAVSSYRFYLRLIEGRARDADAHYNLGAVLEVLRRNEEASEEYRKALAIRPAFAKAWNNLGLLCQQGGRRNEAIDCYRRAIAADENFLLAHFNLGTALTAQGEYAQAAEAFQSARRLDPGHAESAGNLGALYVACGRGAEAAAIFEEFLEREPSNPVLHFNLALACEAAGDRQRARQELRQVIAVEAPGSWRGLRAAAELARLEALP